MRRSLILASVIIVVCLQTGCWSRVELNRLGIISASSLDLSEDNQWVVSFQIIIANSSQGGSGKNGSHSPVTVVSMKGSTILEALQKCDLETPRHLFYSHNRVMIISKRVAEHGINLLMDYYLRNNQARENVNILITDGEAKPYLQVLTPLETIPGNAISNMLNDRLDDQPKMTLSKMYQVMLTLANPTASATMRELKLIGNGSKQQSLDALKTTKNEGKLKLDRVAVFKGDKFKGWISRVDSLGIPWITNVLRSTDIPFYCNGEARKDQLSGFYVEKTHSQLKPRIKDGRLSMSIHIKVKGNLKETACKLELKKSKALNHLKKPIEDAIKEDVKRTFLKLKELKADALGFGDAFHKAYPKEWKKLSKNWEQQFANITMDVTVAVKIRRAGMINDTFNMLSENKD